MTDMTETAQQAGETFEDIVSPAPPEKFATAFVLPENVRAIPGMTELHDEIVADMRREAKGLPLNTVQTLLLERIATFYVLMKAYESGTERINPARLRDLTKEWKDMTTEFNRQLNASHVKLREQLLNDVAAILFGGLSLIEDKDTRNLLRNHYAKELDAIGE